MIFISKIKNKIQAKSVCKAVMKKKKSIMVKFKFQHPGMM